MACTMLAFLPSRLRASLLILLWLAASSLGGWLGYQAFVRAGLETVATAGNNRLDRYVVSLQREIDKFAFLPDVAALQPEVKALLKSPGEVFGSAVSFGAAGQASAPGQIDAGDLRFILQVLAQD